MQPRLVLVHGSMSSAAQWAGYRSLLPEFDVEGIDLPGHGELTGERFTTEGALAVIEQAVSGPAPVILAGHSLGGYLAGLFAGTRPNALAGLILMAATGNPRSSLAGLYRAFSAVTGLVDHDRLARLRQSISRTLGVADGLLPEVPDYATLGAIWEAVMADCPPRVLLGVDCPVLFINGQFDQMRVHERRYRALVPGSTLAIVPRASHVAPLTHPGEVAEIIRSWAQSSARVSAL